MPTPGSSGLRDLRESRSRGGLPSLLRSQVSFWLSLALLAAGGACSRDALCIGSGYGPPELCSASVQPSVSLRMPSERDSVASSPRG